MGKGIVIVGGTSGIGLSAAQAFVKEGAFVLAMGLPVEETIPTDNDNLSFLFADATQEGSVASSIQACVERYGTFDALYHVAGGSGRKFGDGPLHEMSLEGWRKTLELNLDSVMLSNQAAIQHFLKKEKAGVILNTSTVLAYRPSPQFFYTHAYAAAKSAIIGFSTSIAAYYASSNIRVNVIAPALTHTPMAQRAANREDIQAFIQTKQPLDGGRMATPKDLDAAAVYFLSDAAKFTTGQVLAVDGGWSLSEGQYGGN